MTIHNSQQSADDLPDSLPYFTDVLRASSLPKAGPDLLLAIDLDGTTLHHDATVSERMRQAVHAHIAAGTTLIFATGRGITGTQVALGDIGIERGVVVACNGAITASIGGVIPDSETTPLPDFLGENGPAFRLVASHTFDPSREIEILSAGLPSDVWFALETLDEPTRVTYPFPPDELSGPSRLVPLSELSSTKATRLTVRAAKMTARELLDAVAELGLHGVEYAVGWSAWMDITPEGVSKASALEELRLRFGIDPYNTVAVGDSGNDVAMLEWATVGVAMGNAPQYVREYADALTDHVDDDGCAAVLEALL
ncbi:HAD family hydrolase [Arcanobacterium pinnipediorum]|uniref:HAD hydrolase family protein n=1 Tax=Arcanobacterium pinnipediorum TaxID=1503041 RepID=A0ABY5AH71_9ACTO|nr:HAD hydrolase family protein [Arcanobacterium pinnipediorum]USR79345.1 HAD hydrolase family protein [Arcanobacterium pinnipediorum]